VVFKLVNGEQHMRLNVSQDYAEHNKAIRELIETLARDARGMFEEGGVPPLAAFILGGGLAGGIIMPCQFGVMLPNAEAATKVRSMAHKLEAGSVVSVWGERFASHCTVSIVAETIFGDFWLDQDGEPGRLQWLWTEAIVHEGARTAGAWVNLLPRPRNWITGTGIGVC
jgi:hypothetical protein